MTLDRWQRVKELLHQAMQLAPEGRARFLDDACSPEPALRAEVESLLAADAQVPPDFLLPAPATGNLDASDGLQPGQTFAQHFQLLSKLGEGGMGQVWLAEQTAPVRRQVALKLIKAGMYDEAIVQRFKSERQSLAIMDHPAIAKVFEAGTTLQGQPYLIMEYVAGLPITDYCDQKKLSIRQRLELFVQACDGVQHAHQKAIIHRDLKPPNILVVEVDGKPVPRIIDFGLAKASAPRALGESVFTQFGHFLGTPGYMSPEQLAPGVHDVDTRADVYALGVVLYVLLTGLKPFETRQRHQPLDELLRKLREDEPPSPSTKVHSDRESSAATAEARSTDRRQLVSLLRGDLDCIASKALERDRARRYATSSELAADVRRYLNHEPVLARPASVGYRLRKYARRHRVAVATAAGLALLLAAFGVLQALQLRHTMHERDRANYERDRALSLVARNRAVQDFLDLLITEAAQSDKPVSVSDMLARSEVLAASEFHDDPEDHAAVLDMLGIHYHTIGNDTRAQPMLGQALDEVANSRDMDLRAQIRCDHAIVLGSLGGVAQAAATLNAVIDAPGTSDEQAAECLEYLSYMGQDANDGDNALKYGNLALERLRRSPHASPVTEADFIGSIGFAEHLGGHNAQAERDYAQALQMFARAGRERSAEAISVRNNWGIVSDGAGDSKRALEIFQQTLQMVTQDSGKSQVPPYLVGNLARQLENVGRFEEAHATYAQCVDMAAKSGTAAQSMYCLVGLGSVSVSQGDTGAAAEYLGQASAIAAGAVPAGSPSALGLLLTQGRLALERGSLSEARTALTRVISGQRPIATTVRALLARSELNLREGRVEDAGTDARQALAVSQMLQGGIAYSSRTGLAWLMIGRVRSAQGDAPSAHEAFQAAVDHLSHTVDANYPALLDAQRRLGGGATG
jgi:serine/threonine protein kinase/tetratricopeptide (TPR) repeat protein/predicted outer membrane lipoprotein